MDQKYIFVLKKKEIVVLGFNLILTEKTVEK